MRTALPMHVCLRPNHSCSSRSISLLCLHLLYLDFGQEMWLLLLFMYTSL